jgi:hypothetical protein
MSRQFRGGGYWIPESLHLGESLVSMTVTCSQCGAVKGSVNHWFLFWSERHGERVCFTPYDLAGDAARGKRTEDLRHGMPAQGGAEGSREITDFSMKEESMSSQELELEVNT